MSFQRKLESRGRGVMDSVLRQNDSLEKEESRLSLFLFFPYFAAFRQDE
jgi:hypothetical protein